MLYRNQSNGIDSNMRQRGVFLSHSYFAQREFHSKKIGEKCKKIGKKCGKCGKFVPSWSPCRQFIATLLSNYSIYIITISSYLFYFYSFNSPRFVWIIFILKFWSVLFFGPPYIGSPSGLAFSNQRGADANSGVQHVLIRKC